MVTRSGFDAVDGRLDLYVDFLRGSRFACAQCGREGCAVHDTKEDTWRHLDFFQHRTLLHARQVSRLNEALLVAYSAMSGGNLQAVDRPPAPRSRRPKTPRFNRSTIRLSRRALARRAARRASIDRSRTWAGGTVSARATTVRSLSAQLRGTENKDRTHDGYWQGKCRIFRHHAGEERAQRRHQDRAETEAGMPHGWRRLRSAAARALLAVARGQARWRIVGLKSVSSCETSRPATIA